MALQKFPRVFTFSDMNLASTATDIVMTSGKWNKIAYLQVPAQQEIALGAGEVTSGGADTREYAKMRIDSLAGEIKGVARFAYHNANETNIVVVMEQRSENLSTGTSVKLGEYKSLRARQDSYLAIYFNPDSSTTLDASDADNVLLLPVTVYQ